MKVYHFKGLLQHTGWLKNASVTINLEGLITKISTFDPTDTSLDIINGFALPGFQNAHSHAFQYAMAGLAEKHGVHGGHDDFWGWREAMYQLALGVDPDQMEAIATMLYAELVRHGYTNVAEFHYVHHDKNGKPYANRAEMGSRLIEAAKTAGIGITLIAIFYQKGGFGQEPNERQRRFISPTIDDYLQLLEASLKACSQYRQAKIGMGVHSMRGVEPSDIVEIARSGPQDIPFHIHVSEQLKEVADSLQYLGKRPVEWLLENIGLSDRYHLIHATHLNDSETIGIAKSKAHVVLCPSTEGNLGDGLFPLRKYQQEGGKWSIGTDSHIGLNPIEELRILDYGQRLISHKRNTYTSPKQDDSGMYAITMATRSGRMAMGNNSSEFFKIGEYLNATLIDASSPLIATTSVENLASTLVYASDSSMYLGTISHGKMLPNTQDSDTRQDIIEKFKTAITQLKNR
jgi:formimidoylglutamate deiminase